MCDVETIRIVMDFLVAFGTIFLACAAYKQIKEFRFVYKRSIALDIASSLTCLLAYIKDCYGFSHPLLRNIDLKTCIGGESIIDHAAGNRKRKMYKITEAYFTDLFKRIEVLSEALNDINLKGKISQLLSDKNVLKLFHRYKDECIPGDKEAEKYYTILWNILSYIIKKYSLSASDIELKCRELVK